MTDTMEINLNENVRVKLTDYGRLCHHQTFIEHWNRYPIRTKPKYTPPKVDAEGFSTFMLWELMSEFGRFIQMGVEPCFDRNSICIAVTDTPIDQKEETHGV